MQAGLLNPEQIEEEEEVRPWVPFPGEAEDEAAERDAQDPRLAINPNGRNLLEVGEEVRRRLIEFLYMNRAHEVNEGMEGYAEIPDELVDDPDDEFEYELVIE